MRDMDPRSTPTLMEIHMTTYKPTGEKPDEFNLYLQGRSSVSIRRPSRQTRVLRSPRFSLI